MKQSEHKSGRELNDKALFICRQVTLIHVIMFEWCAMTRHIDLEIRPLAIISQNIIIHMTAVTSRCYSSRDPLDQHDFGQVTNLTSRDTATWSLSRDNDPLPRDRSR